MGYDACGISDYKTISGAVSFFQNCKKHEIKPIIGVSFDDLKLFAKNKEGWHDLIRIVSSIDEDGNEDKAYITSIYKKGNLICVHKDKSTADRLGVFYQDDNMKDSYYTKKEDAELHRVLLASGMKTTLPKVKSNLRSGKDFENKEFFADDCFFVQEGESSEVLENIYNEVEEFNILNKPMLPKFPTPNGESEDEYLKQLARKGWKEKLGVTGKATAPETKEEYKERFLKEFEVIEKADLFGYFLIVCDIIKYANKQGWMTGPGRGSAAGCLVSYLIDITQVDPVEFDLIFERFYNEGRNTEDHISLPDIDIDVPGRKRDEIIEYIKDVYGHDNVSQMVTFGRLQGRSALKEVLRINEACGFAEMNEITKKLPNEADISTQLAEMDDDERSIILWSLQNNPDDFIDYCFINSKGELEGDYAEYFEQAIKMEGTFKTQGKHAAGVVISAEKLSEVCPMVNSKSSDEKIAGLEMADLEALGHVKFDILAINFLDKCMYIEDLIGKT